METTSIIKVCVNMQKKDTLKNHTGFTLLEMIITISIISALFLVALPNFMGLKPKMTLNGATRVMASDLMAARMNAVKLNQSVYLEYSGAQNYQIATRDNIIKSNNLNEEYRGVQIGSDFGKITFDSRGGSTGTSTINLTNTSGGRNISINIAGRIKIQ